MLSARPEYESRLRQRQESLRRAEQQHARIGTGRLFTAVAAGAILWLVLEHHISIAWLALPLAAFTALVITHSRVDRQRRLAQRAADFYSRGLERLADRWAGTGETGERFRDPNHPFADDLDLFGPASLFELLSTARTRAGEATLADWLLRPAAREEVRARQAAIDDLRERLDLREDLAVLGQDFRTGVHPAALSEWSRAAPVVFPAYLRVLAPCFALLAFGLIVAFFATGLLNPWVRIALVLTGLAEGALVWAWRARIDDVAAAVEQPGHDLALLSQVLRRLEAERFRSPKLATLRAALDVEGQPASARIARLERLIDHLDSRDNPAVRVIGPLLMWTTQLAMRIEDWRKVSGPHVPEWLAAVGEMEALSALANYAFEHPADPFPVIAESGVLFDGRALGHPLLPDAKCVRNDVCLSSGQPLIVISGSNMSGKSTLLRTVGINTVLALAGAPVRAGGLTLSPVRLGASIRINDSLQGGASRFYAEITRIRNILKLCEEGTVLFLLDELLNGTNSHDRQIGAQGVVLGLLKRGAIGFITTHDLALTAIAGTNMHFEDHLEDGVMTFDYRIRLGVVEKSNALELMRAVGLEV
jgi:hypothetical protein